MKEIKYRNFETHQKQRAYMVFYYYAKDHADYFEALLIEQGIPYERGQGKDMLRRHLIGIHKSHQAIAQELNDKTNNYYRKPFLGDKTFRNFVLFITFVVVLLALVGFFMG